MVLVLGTSYKRLVAQPEITWSNAYMFQAANTIACLDLLEDVAGHEAAVMGETAEVYRLHCKTPAPGTIGAIRDVSIAGVQPVADPDTMLPMWNTVIVKFFNVAGRPELKYLRLPLYIDMIEGQTINNATLTTVSLDYATHLAGNEFYVGPDGEPHQNGFEVESVIQMRQTNWHRRTRPGFKRGWVPV